MDYLTNYFQDAWCSAGQELEEFPHEEIGDVCEAEILAEDTGPVQEDLPQDLNEDLNQITVWSNGDDVIPYEEESLSTTMINIVSEFKVTSLDLSAAARTIPGLNKNAKEFTPAALIPRSARRCLWEDHTDGDTDVFRTSSDPEYSPGMALLKRSSSDSDLQRCVQCHFYYLISYLQYVHIPFAMSY